MCRRRRHEAEAAFAALADEAPDGEGQPSADSLAVSRLGLIGLGMVPFVGAFAGALDADARGPGDGGPWNAGRSPASAPA